MNNFQSYAEKRKEAGVSLSMNLCIERQSTSKMIMRTAEDSPSMAMGDNCRDMGTSGKKCRVHVLLLTAEEKRRNFPYA